MSDAFRIVRDDDLGEEVWLATTAAGLRLRVLPRPQLQETAAVVAFAYGSTDLAFASGGCDVVTPAGSAHYLEHKLFEDDELAVFQRFAARGARVNAQTGFSRTSYYFLASDRIEANLTDLLRLVSRPHITPANVQKERGIIAQEVRMYEDSPDRCTTFDLLGCLFPEHPARHTIGGTVESIEAITADGLLQCWDAFYRTGNAALAVAGPVDPAAVLAIAEACGLPAGPPPVRRTAADHGPIGRDRCVRRMPVARPKVRLGFKERTPAEGWRERARRSLRSGVVLDRLFAASSELREAMHRRGEVDDSLSAGYLGEQTFSFAQIGCDGADPDAAEAALRRALAQDVAFDDAHLDGIRRRQLGGMLRACESVRALAFGHVHEELEGVEPFQVRRLIEELRVDDVVARRHELLDPANLAVARTEP